MSDKNESTPKFRVWKLGNLEHKIYPTEAAVRKLADILRGHEAGGCLDLIWGPDIEIQEVKHGDEIEECVVEQIQEDGDEVRFIARRIKGTGTTEDKGDEHE